MQTIEKIEIIDTFILDDLKNEIELYFTTLPDKERPKSYILKRYFKKFFNLDALMFYMTVIKDGVLTSYTKQLKLEFFFTKNDLDTQIRIKFVSMGDMTLDKIPDNEEGEEFIKGIKSILENIITDIREVIPGLIKMNLINLNREFIEIYKSNKNVKNEIEKLNNTLLFKEYDLVYIPIKNELLYTKGLERQF